jgi:hypothetical protein
LPTAAGCVQTCCTSAETKSTALVPFAASTLATSPDSSATTHIQPFHFVSASFIRWASAASRLTGGGLSGTLEHQEIAQHRFLGAPQPGDFLSWYAFPTPALPRRLFFVTCLILRQDYIPSLGEDSRKYAHRPRLAPGHIRTLKREIKRSARAQTGRRPCSAGHSAT